MGGQVLHVTVTDATADGLGEWARARKAPVEQVASEALEIVTTIREQPGAPIAWSEDDIAAIRQGVAQADRGELVSQDVVEREIDDLLR